MTKHLRLAFCQLSATNGEKGCGRSLSSYCEDVIECDIRACFNYLTRVVHLFILNVYSLELTGEKRRIYLLVINHIFITSGEMMIGYFYLKLVNILVFPQISKPKNDLILVNELYIFMQIFPAWNYLGNITRVFNNKLSRIVREIDKSRSKLQYNPRERAFCTKIVSRVQ